MKENVVQIRSSDVRRYKRCNKTIYNVRTCQEIKETSEEDSDIEDNQFSCIVTVYDSQKVTM